MSQKNQDSIELSVTSVAFGGKGVAKLDNKVYFVSGTVPGDIIKAKITLDKKNFGEATVTEFLKRSALRTPPPCSYADICGGCQWQGIAYTKQLEWKQSFIRDALTRISKFDLHDIIKVNPSPLEYNYRNRVTLRGTITEDGQVKVGYFKAGTKEQVHIKECFIANSDINDLITHINNLKVDDQPQKFRLEVQQIPAAQHQDKKLLITLFPLIKPYSQIKHLLKSLQQYKHTSWCDTQDRIKSAMPVLFEEHQDIKYYSTPGQFQQINTEHNQLLRQKIKDAILQHQSKSLFDLYCGSGNLSLQFKGLINKLYGVEFNESSIKVAKVNTTANSIENFQYKQGDAFVFLEKLTKQKIKVDAMIVDPPRKGMKDIVAHIKRFAPTDIIYVSCDPTTMARDLALLEDQYNLMHIEGFDFFPQTYHVESFAILKRKLF